MGPDLAGIFSVINFFEFRKILRGFLVFWSFFNVKLQLDRSRRLERVERADFTGTSFLSWTLVSSAENSKILRGFLLFWSFLNVKLQLDRSQRLERVERADFTGTNSLS